MNRVQSGVELLTCGATIKCSDHSATSFFTFYIGPNFFIDLLKHYSLIRRAGLLEVSRSFFRFGYKSRVKPRPVLTTSKYKSWDVFKIHYLFVEHNKFMCLKKSLLKKHGTILKAFDSAFKRLNLYAIVLRHIFLDFHFLIKSRYIILRVIQMQENRM